VVQLQLEHWVGRDGVAPVYYNLAHLPTVCQAPYQPSFRLACFRPDSILHLTFTCPFSSSYCLLSPAPPLSLALQRANHLALQRATAHHYAILSRAHVMIPSAVEIEASSSVLETITSH